MLIAHVIRTEKFTASARKFLQVCFPGQIEFTNNNIMKTYVHVILVFVIKVVNITMHMTPNGCLSLHNM